MLRFKPDFSFFFQNSYFCFDSICKITRSKQGPFKNYEIYARLMGNFTLQKKSSAYFSVCAEKSLAYNQKCWKKSLAYNLDMEKKSLAYNFFFPKKVSGLSFCICRKSQRPIILHLQKVSSLCESKSSRTQIKPTEILIINTIHIYKLVSWNRYTSTSSHFVLTS